MGWGEAFYSPTDGSDNYDGLTRQTPKRTLGAALQTGAGIVHVAEGTHQFTSINRDCTLLFHPGVHDLAGAPVVTANAVTLAKYGSAHPQNTRYSITGEPFITAPHACTDYFQYDAGNGGVSNMYGGSVIGLRWNPGPVSRSAVWGYHWNQIDFMHNSWSQPPGTAFKEIYLLYLYRDDQSGKDTSWVNFVDNHAQNVGLLRREGSQYGCNRWNVMWNKGALGTNPAAEQTGPFFWLSAGLTNGMTMTANSLEGVRAADGVGIRIDGTAMNCTFDNKFEGFQNGAKMYDIAAMESSIFHHTSHLKGDIIQIGNTTYRGTPTVDTVDSNNNKILILAHS